MVRSTVMRALLFTIALCVLLLQMGGTVRPAGGGVPWAAGFPRRVPAGWSGVGRRHQASGRRLHRRSNGVRLHRLVRVRQARAVEAEDLKQLVPPDWLDDRLAVQADTAAMQANAGDAAQGSVAAALQFGDEFADLVVRDVVATSAAIDRCPAFAATNDDWDQLNQDFQPGKASPVPAGSPVIAVPG